MNDVRVCHVVNAVGETSIPAQIATGLNRYTKVEATLLAWFNASAFPNDDRVTVSCLEASGHGASYSTLRAAADVLRDHDVVHTHHNHAGAYGKVIAKTLRTPVISTEHNDHSGFDFLGKFANGTTNLFADRVTCVSGAVCDSFDWWETPLVRSRKRGVIYNGVDLERVSEAITIDWRLRDAIDEDGFVVGMAAMHTEQKAHDVLIGAVARANDSLSSEISLVLTGDGPLRDSLKARAEGLGIDDRVHFLGIIETDKLYRTLADIDVFCMPSRWEGFCVAVAEAMALGTPCILSEIVVFNEVYGDAALTHPVDDDEGLADKLVELAQDERQREALSERGKELVEKTYSLRQTAQSYADCYRSVLGTD